MQIERLSLATQAVLRLHPHPSRFSFLTEGRYAQLQRPIDKSWLVRHVLGDACVGAVSCDDDGKTTVVGIDLDAHKDDQSPDPAARRFVDAALAWDVPVLVHLSKSGKGYHIRTIFSDRVDGYLARCLYLCIANAAQVDSDAAFDKVWPPSAGYGVLALPLNCGYIKSTGGTIALEPTTFEPIAMDQQIEAILEARAMDAEELTGTLVAMDVPTEELARQIAGASKKRLSGSAAADGTDGGLTYMTDNCHAVHRLIHYPLEVRYDFWVSMASNFKPFIGGKEVFQAIQQNHYQVDPSSGKYHPRRFEHIWRPLRNPHLCSALCKDWECPSLGQCGCRAPAALPFWIKKMGACYH